MGDEAPQDAQVFLDLFVREMNMNQDNGQGNQNQQQRCSCMQAIPCNNYVLGQDFGMWLGHFQDNLRAAHELQQNDATLPDLYANWVSKKMEPGPTRTIYDNLPDNVKDPTGSY
jgi:hypothetical protein